MTKLKTISVLGPTASGKTALSIALAKQLDGEIISCDSMQLYRGMDIGTATPDLTERDGIPHHLFDICDPEDSFSAADYAAAAVPVIADEGGVLAVYGFGVDETRKTGGAYVRMEFVNFSEEAEK